MWTITRRGGEGGSGTASERTRPGRRRGRQAAAFSTVAAESAGEEDRPGAREAQAVLRRGGEVELVPAGVRAAVDDRDADGPPGVAQRDLRAARQRLARDAERVRRQRPAAAQMPAVQARPVPRRARAAVDVQPADVPAGGLPAHADDGAARPARVEAEGEGAAGGGALAVDRPPAGAGAALQRDGAAGVGAGGAAAPRRAGAGDDVQAAAGDRDVARAGSGALGGR